MYVSDFEVDSQWRLFGTEGWLYTFNLPASQIQSAIIYDDRMEIYYLDQNGGRYGLTSYLWQGYSDVLSAIRVRARDDDDPSGYSYIQLSFANGAVDDTPVRLNGSLGDDVLYGAFGNDVIKAGNGDDILHGERQADNHWLGGNDKLFGGGGHDTLYGYRGDDVLNGGRGNDTAYGGLGNDKLIGAAGNDELHGGAGADRLLGGKGTDILLGGEGDDLLDGGKNNDSLHGESGHDTLLGGKGDDTLSGGADNDKLSGGAGNDRLYGNDGNDTLDGGSGSDILDGGAGNDQLTGGKGADIFVFHRPDAGTKNDHTVTDFEIGVDKIRIGDDLLSKVLIDTNLNTDDNTITSIIVKFSVEPDWTTLLLPYMSGGITHDELQHAGRHVSAGDFRYSHMTLDFDGSLSLQDLHQGVVDEGGLNALLFDVV